MLSHIAILGLLVFDLWAGAPLVSRVLGTTAASGFELALIAGYLLIVVGLGFPARSRD